jgi:uncharacterized protein Usg
MIGGQAGLVSPILFVLLAIVTARAFRRTASDVAYTLGIVAAFTFLFFCYSATRQRVEANWPAPAYIAAIPLLAASPLSSVMRKWLDSGVWFAGGLSVLIYLHAAFGILPIPPRKDPIARAAGWNDLAAAAISAERRSPSGAQHGTWVAADRYQDAAEIAFHLPDYPTVFSLNFGGRSNQYDLWPAFPDVAKAGDALVLALDERLEVHETVERLATCFQSFVRDSLVNLSTRRGVVSQRRLWILHGWNGSWPTRS